MVYKREDIPKELNIKDNKRVGDIMVIAEPGYMLMKPNESYKMGITTLPTLLKLKIEVTFVLKRVFTAI